MIAQKKIRAIFIARSAIMIARIFFCAIIIIFFFIKKLITKGYGVYFSGGSGYRVLGYRIQGTGYRVRIEYFVPQKDTTLRIVSFWGTK